MSNVYPFPPQPGGPAGDLEDRLPVKIPPRSSKREPSKELVPQVFEAEIVDPDDPDQPTPVDLPVVPDVRRRWERPAELQPIIPDWAADPETRRDVVSWHLHRIWYGFRYHGVRSPWYAVRLAAKSPVGAARVAGATMRWASASYIAERIEGVKTEPRAVTSLTIEESRQAGIRWSILGAGLLAAFVGWWLTGRNHVSWDRPLIIVLLIALFGVVADRRSDRPVLGPAVHVEELPKLTADMVLTALSSLGITGINAAIKDGWERRAFPEPIKVDGPGWRADVDLPHGVTAANVMDKRKELASALRRPLGAVWPGPDPTVHEGRLIIWVGRQSMDQMKPPPWPLAKAGQADLFKPVPFGHDQRGRLITVTLMYANMLIGAIPRMGKTFALRVLLLAAALDPRVELRLFELKGTGDFSPLEPVAHHYASGAGDDAVEACVASLKEVYGLLESRAKTLSKIAKENRALCPENKVTPELAARRQFKLWPIVFGVDECQVLFTHPDLGEEAGRLCEAIIKRGPALGIILILATQRPDAKSLPTGISSNVAIRFCLRVMGQVENDMVLGTSSYKNGIRATTLTARDKGIGYLLGDADDPQIVRSSYLDGPASERIVTRARALREAAGTLSGYAIDEQDFDTGPDTSLLHDLLQVMEPTEDQIHSDVACTRLAEAWAARYDGWKPTTLAAALGALKVKTKRNTWAERPDGQMDNRAGVTRESLLDALGEPAAD